jgi:SOS response regulatory protein OraA/RecX
MKIEVVSVSALSDGAEMMISVLISNGECRTEKRKFLLFTEQYLELGIRKGSIIDESDVDRLEELSKSCRAIKKGSDLLSYSASSKARLAHRLRSKGIDKKSAESAAEHLEKLGLINEEVDVERQVALCLKKLWGKKRIYRELCAKGYEREIVQEAIAILDDETIVRNCVALIRKKYKIIPEDPGDIKKVVAALTRYGYTFYEIKEAFRIIQK